MNENDQHGKSSNEISLREFQDLIADMFGHKDEARGTSGTFMWFMEEVGELAAALRSDNKEELALEFADVLAWLATLANTSEIDLTEAIRLKYAKGCPGCGAMRCTCSIEEKP